MNEPVLRSVVVAQGKLYEKFGRRYHPSLVSLDKYTVYAQTQPAALAAVRKARAEIAAIVDRGQPILFYGTWGTGKDFFMANLLYAACTVADRVEWFSAQEIYGEFRDAMSSKRLEKHILRPMLIPNVLGISDPIPPAGTPSPWNALSLYRVLDHRYRRRLCTWMTLNADNREEARRKLTPAVFERMIHEAIVVPCFWPSFREEARPQPANGTTTKRTT